MSHTKKRSLSVALCFILMCTMIIPASARASEYFHRTYVTATNIGGGTLSIMIDLAATGTMQEVGEKEVIVYEKKSNGNYESVYTFTREAYPSLISYNRLSHVSYVTYYGSPGKSYYISAAFYAKNANGSQTLWGSSSVVRT